MKLRTCVGPDGRFLYGIHQPRYRVANLRRQDLIRPLGTLPGGTVIDNRRNFPADDVDVEQADWIFEIPNPFPFRGTTYIARQWAEARAADPESIGLPRPAAVSFRQAAAAMQGRTEITAAELSRALAVMPESLLLALAATSTDPADLIALAHLSCELQTDAQGRPLGLGYRNETGPARPVVHRHLLFEVLANNPSLPDAYRQVMVLRPGAQGSSEIVGELAQEGVHLFEYLRQNSYIPWGHYAANFADDDIRYSAGRLNHAAMAGLRHLYYQRTFVRLAGLLGLPVPHRRPLTPAELEELRLAVLHKKEGSSLPFTATLWGWNYGFDFAPSGYRLHASHQQIHQQFALLPDRVKAWHAGGEPAGELAAYGCGELVADFTAEYRRQTGHSFFESYLQAIRTNRRMDGRDGESSLIVYEDERVMLFVPKAQTSQWEMQVMPTEPVGNILEADAECRRSLDRALLIAMRILDAMGARLVTSIEFPKRFDACDSDQRLLYALLPRLPESPGAFSEAQLRFISGHYPEDFAAACRLRLPEALKGMEDEAELRGQDRRPPQNGAPPA